MSMYDLIEGVDAVGEGVWMRERIVEWFPISRSITGPGLRETLRGIGALVPLSVTEVPTGEQVFDWTIPPEWSVRDAWIADSRGQRIVDFGACNLHVVGYSAPVRGRFSLEELQAHCYSDPERPELIPYRTSYFREQWGFCLAHSQLAALVEGEYEVCIDSTLAPGALSYGECVLPGQSEEEVLITAHACHPSLANDNLSGIAVAVAAARLLAGVERRYTYRFLFAPGTIGAIAWLARNEARLGWVKHGLVLACVGDGADPRYKRSRRGDAAVDRAMLHALRHSGRPYRVEDFTPYGYDQRQFCSPGINLPVGCFMRSGPGGYPEYHSSGDNLKVIKEDALADSLRLLLTAFAVLEADGRYVNLSPKGEPQLGRRGLFSDMGGRVGIKEFEHALLWVLNFSDGDHSLLEIAERSGLAMRTVHEALRALVKAGLLAPAGA